MKYLDTADASKRRFYFSAKHYGPSNPKHTNEAHRRFKKYAVMTHDALALLHIVSLDGDGDIVANKVCGIIQVTREKIFAGTVKQELKKAFGVLGPTIVVEPILDDEHWVAKFAKLKEERSTQAASEAKLQSLGISAWVEDGAMPEIPPVAMEVDEAVGTAPVVAADG